MKHIQLFQAVGRFSVFLAIALKEIEVECNLDDPFLLPRQQILVARQRIQFFSPPAL